MVNKILGLCFLFISCAPKLKSTITQVQESLAEDALVVVLDPLDQQVITDDLIGSVAAKDGGFAVNCTYYENLLNLKIMARQAGANLIKLTAYKAPDKWSSCHRLKANLYRVDQPKLYETKIHWTANRKLTWDDFKGEPDRKRYPNALALTNSGFGYEAGVNMFKDGKVFVQSVFNTYQSWVLPEGRTDYVLRHEQIHFDITEVYSRKLRKALADANITSSNAAKAQPIFERIFKEMQQRQERYDQDTQRGDKTETQEYWEAVVAVELEKYAFYKRN